MDARKKSRKDMLIPRRISSDYDDDENIAEMQVDPPFCYNYNYPLYVYSRMIIFFLFKPIRCNQYFNILPSQHHVG